MILIKHYDSIELSHLYEHLFFATIHNFFRDHGLHPYLDYNVHGQSFPRGIIYIEVDFYTDAARSLAKEIPQLNIDLQFETVTIGVSQIIAEKEQSMDGLGYEAIRRALTELHEQPWQYIDDVHILDTGKVRMKSGALFAIKGRLAPARKLQTAVSLDAPFMSSSRELLPLFHGLAALILERLQIDIVAAFGYYSTELLDEFTSRSARRISIFKVPGGSHVELDDVSSIVSDALETLEDDKAFERFVTELRKVSHDDAPELLPSSARIYEDTSVLVGAQGWRKLATSENCRLLLKHMSIELTYGRKRATQPVQTSTR